MMRIFSLYLSIRLRNYIKNMNGYYASLNINQKTVLP